MCIFYSAGSCIFFSDIKIAQKYGIFNLLVVGAGSLILNKKWVNSISIKKDVILSQLKFTCLLSH